MEKIIKLPDSELEIMIIIWNALSQIHTGDILVVLKEKRDNPNYSLQALQSTLKRLEGKKFIKCNKRGRLNYYRPAVNREKYQQFILNHFLDTVFEGDSHKLREFLLNIE